MWILDPGCGFVPWLMRFFHQIQQKPEENQIFMFYIHEVFQTKTAIMRLQLKNDREKFSHPPNSNQSPLTMKASVLLMSYAEPFFDACLILE